jgi:hypothetical protein
MFRGIGLKKIRKGGGMKSLSAKTFNWLVNFFETLEIHGGHLETTATGEGCQLTIDAYSQGEEVEREPEPYQLKWRDSPLGEELVFYRGTDLPIYLRNGEVVRCEMGDLFDWVPVRGGSGFGGTVKTTDEGIVLARCSFSGAVEINPRWEVTLVKMADWDEYKSDPLNVYDSPVVIGEIKNGKISQCRTGVIDTYLSYTDGEVPYGPHNINSINRTQLTGSSRDGRVVLQLLDFDQGDTGTLSVGNKNYDFVMRDNSGHRRINYLSLDDVSDFIDPLPDGTVIPGRVVKNQYGDLLQYRLTWNKASREFEESAEPWPINLYTSN